MGWQWHQLDHMQIICTSLQTDNQTTTPVPHHSVLQAGCPLCHPTNNVKALKAKTLCVTTNTKTDHVQDVPPSQSLSIVLKKLNLTQQKTSKPKDITTQNEHQKLNKSFGCIVQHSTWQQIPPILTISYNSGPQPTWSLTNTNTMDYINVCPKPEE